MNSALPGTSPTGAHSLSTRASAFRTGAHSLYTRASAFSTGAHSLYTRASAFRTGVYSLYTGASAFRTGAHSLSTRASAFRTGVYSLRTRASALYTSVFPCPTGGIPLPKRAAGSFPGLCHTRNRRPPPSPISLKEGFTTDDTDFHEWCCAPGQGSSFVTIRVIRGFHNRHTPALQPAPATCMIRDENQTNDRR